MVPTGGGGFQVLSRDKAESGKPVSLRLRTSIWQGMPGSTGPILRLGWEAASLQHA